MTKSQIDKLGEQLRAGDEGPDVRQALESYRASFRKVDQSAAQIISTLGYKRLAISRRSGKSTPSIIAKLQRETIRLSQMQDIAGCRIVFEYLSEQNEFVRRLQRKSVEKKIDDRRDVPSHGYRAVHVVLVIEGLPYEVQVRTFAQDLWAQLIEKLSDNAYPGLKYGEGPAELLAEVHALSSKELEFDRVKDELWTMERQISGALSRSHRLVTPIMVGSRQRRIETLARELDERFEKLGFL